MRELIHKHTNTLAYIYMLACSFSHLYTHDTIESNCQRAKGSETEYRTHTHTYIHTRTWRIKKVKSSDAKGLDSIIFCDIAFYVSCIILLMSPQFSLVYINCLTSSLDSFSISFSLRRFFPSSVFFLLLLRFAEIELSFPPMFSAMLNFIYIPSSHFAMRDQDVGNISSTNDKL